jgi:hypothetical protein
VHSSQTYSWPDSCATSARSSAGDSSSSAGREVRITVRAWMATTADGSSMTLMV